MTIHQCLAAGGSISVAEGSTPAFAIVSIAFNAQVTDDSYSDYLGLPNAGYWGAWIVAIQQCNATNTCAV